MAPAGSFNVLSTDFLADVSGSALCEACRSSRPTESSRNSSSLLSGSLFAKLFGFCHHFRSLFGPFLSH